MKKLFPAYFTLLSLFVILSGCASIIHGTRQEISFTSQPSGASITIDGKPFGTTPQIVSLKRNGRLDDESAEKKEYAVKLEMEGYYPYELKLTREMDSWFLGNLLFGGIIGIIVDASNGAMYKLTPDQVNAQMGQSTSMSSQKLDDGIYIAVTMEVDPTWERIGTVEKVH